MEMLFPNGKKLRLLIGDITKIRVEAIVNAANSELRGGGGVDGAIHRAGGPAIMRELNDLRPAIGRCLPGNAIATGAGAMPAKYVFHAVGPIYRDGRHDEPEELASCYERCLEMAEELGVRTISFPAISTGAYGYPMAEAARISLHALGRHLERADTGVREVLFVLFDQASLDVHVAAARDLFPDQLQ